MYDLLIKNAHVVTLNAKREIIFPGAVAITGDSIAAVGKVSDFDGAEARRVIDATGSAVFPGFVNTHTHLFQSLLKGLGDDRPLSEWLVTATLPSAVRFRETEIYTSAVLGCLDALHSGTTTILDYNYCHPVPGLGDETIRGFREVGIRAILARGMTVAGEKFGIPPAMRTTAERAFADFCRLYDAYHGADNDRLRVWLAPGSVWGNTPEALRGARALATETKTGLTIHTSETPWDREAAAVEHGVTSDFAALEKARILGPDVLLVHMVHVTPEEITRAARYAVKISHNPVSNMYLASGVAPVPAMIREGLTCSLGTDGAASNNTQDMIEALKMTVLMHKVVTMDPVVITAEKVLEMATIDGARSLGMADRIGSLEPGKRADLFIFDPTRAPRSVPMHHPVSTLVYSGGVDNVATVVVDGRVLIDDGQAVTVDERAFLARAQQVSADLAERAGTAENVRRRPWRSLPQSNRRDVD
ncbi:MAG TPA: amidohydrolase [Bacillota bacterium]|jgi:5-methylthioadenosine/S-adenosylhomocysteine deaminase